MKKKLKLIAAATLSLGILSSTVFQKEPFVHASANDQQKSKVQTTAKKVTAPKTKTSKTAAKKKTAPKAKTSKTTAKKKTAPKAKTSKTTAKKKTAPKANTSKTTAKKKTAPKANTSKATAKKETTQKTKTPKSTAKMKIDSPFYSTRETNNSKIGFVYLVAEIGKGNDELPMYFEYNKDGYKGTLKRTQGYLTKNTENEKDISKQQFYSAYVGEIFKTN